ncbi:MAG: prefoldin subunit alpha [Candidatus Pacearchaeota archaeon]|nr:prefoldin subunit alpha [Candidatus Pacearchaeota archaeon]
MANEELLYRITILEQEAKKMEENIKAVNEQISEFETLKLSLKSIDKEILAGLGKGVFIKSQVEEEDFLVNIGCGILVKKSKAQASEIIDKQIKEMEELKVKLLGHIEHLNNEMSSLVEKAPN